MRPSFPRLHRVPLTMSTAASVMIVCVGSEPDASWASSEATRRSMRSNRGRDTGPEWRVRRLLHARGLRYRVNAPLPFDSRRADVLFVGAKVAVFIDGCFWHGCPQHYTAPATNREYWHDKVVGNAARDRDTDRRLAEDGWTVLRFWEHQDAESEVVPTILSELAARGIRPPDATTQR